MTELGLTLEFLEQGRLIKVWKTCWM